MEPELQISKIKIKNVQRIENPDRQKMEIQEGNKVYDLRERLLIFSKRILKISKMLPKIPECEGIRKQL